MSVIRGEPSNCSRDDLSQVQTMPTQPEDALKLEYELIGCELHDGPCQYIASAQMLLEALRHQGTASTHDDSCRLDTALRFLERAGVELRRLIRGLHPLQLHDTRMLAIVECLSDENKMDGGPEIEWCLDAEFDELPNDLRVADSAYPARVPHKRSPPQHDEQSARGHYPRR